MSPNAVVYELLAAHLLASAAVGLLARSRGRSAVSWFLLSLFLSFVVAGAMLMGLPDERGADGNG